ncbi:MAG: 30S ribosomal protein S17e [Candidatus Aenigmatarchaeota archaeon]
MGNVRTTQIKTISERLIKLYPNQFTFDFNENKKKIGEILPLESKIMRNKIAGYITHNLSKMNRLSTLKITYQNPNLEKRKKKKKKR